jgi:hypothetical protein
VPGIIGSSIPRIEGDQLRVRKALDGDFSVMEKIEGLSLKEKAEALVDYKVGV